MNKKTLFISTLLLLVLLFVGGTLFYDQNQSATDPEQAMANQAQLVRIGGPSKGDPQARVHLVEFLDPACETCARFYPFVQDLMAKHPGQIRISVRYAPFHKGSDYMVKILEAAHNQGKFWQTLEIMFTTQADWASHQNPQPQNIWKHLGELNLDMARMAREINEPEMDRIIQKELQDISALKVNKTPEFFVNGRPLPRFGFEPLQELIEEELSRNR